MDPYTLIIIFSATIIGSYFFNIIARRTKIPAVLLLMGAGMAIQGAVKPADVDTLEGMLPILGNVGLIMIVLEAALDLELRREKLTLILKSFVVAVVGLGLCVTAAVFIIYHGMAGLFDIHPTYTQAFAYAIPLSIMSSAIIIPSVISLRKEPREFMIYESTFSDILGIMLFYFLMGSSDQEGPDEVILGIVGNIVLTVILAAVVSYGLVYIFQRIKSQIKLFLIISVLMLMYALGKKLHLSSLVVILAFGLVLNNTRLFFRGRLSRFVNESSVAPIMRDFHIITLETAFVVRTFFFLIFGITITLSSLVNWKVAALAGGILASIFIVRLIVMKLVVKRRFVTMAFIAPRGLITILLFFSIIQEHQEFMIPGFDSGILLYIILMSSIIMAIALIADRGEKVTNVLISNIKENIQDLKDLPKSVLHELQGDHHHDDPPKKDNKPESPQQKEE
jgi:NhaP-type Na+/H+ or K+/H+ antiporter